MRQQAHPDEQETSSYAVSGIGGLFQAPEVDVIFSILAYLGGFNKLWDSKAGDGETPEPADIYEQAAEIFLLPTKRQFVKDLSSLHDDLQKQYRLKLQGLYGDILKLLGVEDERRLFYVGLTRAKKFLFVTTSR